MLTNLVRLEVAVKYVIIAFTDKLAGFHTEKVLVINTIKLYTKKLITRSTAVKQFNSR